MVLWPRCALSGSISPGPANSEAVKCSFLGAAGLVCPLSPPRSVVLASVPHDSEAAGTQSSGRVGKCSPQHRLPQPRPEGLTDAGQLCGAVLMEPCTCTSWNPSPLRYEHAGPRSVGMSVSCHPHGSSYLEGLKILHGRKPK